MPKGTLDPPQKGYITPKKANPGESPDYSPAYEVDLSPIKDLKKEAEIQSRQEEFNKQLAIAARKGGKKTRKQRRRKTRKTRRRS